MFRILAVLRFGARLPFRSLQLRHVSTETSRYDKFFGQPVNFDKPSPRRNPLFEFIESHSPEESINKLRNLSKNGQIKLSPALGVYIYRIIMTSPDKFDDAIKTLSDPTIGIHFPVKENIQSILDITFNISPDRVIDIIKLNTEIPKQYYIDFNNDVINRTHGLTNYIIDIDKIYKDIDTIRTIKLENKPSDFPDELPKKLTEHIDKKKEPDNTKLNEKDQILGLDNVIKKDKLLNQKSDDAEREIKVRNIGKQLDKIEELMRKQSLDILYNITKYQPGSTLPTEPIVKPIGRVTKDIDFHEKKKIINGFSAPELYEIYTQQLQNNFITQNYKFEDTYKRYVELYNKSSEIEIVKSNIKLNENKFDTPLSDTIKNLQTFSIDERVDKSMIPSTPNSSDNSTTYTRNTDNNQRSESQISSNETNKQFSGHNSEQDIKSGSDLIQGHKLNIAHTSDRNTRDLYNHLSPKAQIEDIDLNNDRIPPISESTNTFMEIAQSTNINCNSNENITNIEKISLNNISNDRKASHDTITNDHNKDKVNRSAEIGYNPFLLGNQNKDTISTDSSKFGDETYKQEDSSHNGERESTNTQKVGKLWGYISSIKSWINKKYHSSSIKKIITHLKDNFFLEYDDKSSPYTMDECIKIVADYVLDRKHKEIYDYLKAGGHDTLDRDKIEDAQKAEYVSLIKNIAKTFYVYTKSDPTTKREMMNDILNEENLEQISSIAQNPPNNFDTNQKIQSNQAIESSTNSDINQSDDNIRKQRNKNESPEYLKRQHPNTNNDIKNKQFQHLSRAIIDTLKNDLHETNDQLSDNIKTKVAKVLSNSSGPLHNYNKPQNVQDNPDELTQEINKFTIEVDEEFFRNDRKSNGSPKYYNRPVDSKLIDDVFGRIDRIFNDNSSSKVDSEPILFDPSQPEDAIIEISLDHYKDKLHEMGIDSDDYKHFDTLDQRDFEGQNQDYLSSVLRQDHFDGTASFDGMGEIPQKLDQYLKNLKDPDDKPQSDYTFDDLNNLTSELMKNL